MSEDFFVGEVVGFQGLAGEVKVRPATNSPEILLNIETVTVHQPQAKGNEAKSSAQNSGTPRGANTDSAAKTGSAANEGLRRSQKNGQAVTPHTVSTLNVNSARLEKRLLLLKFDEYQDRTAVEHLIGSRLFCKEAELESLEEENFWVRDLVGLTVFTTEGRCVGKVIGIMYGGNDILEIQPDNDQTGKTIMVPFVQHLVPTVDLKGGRIEVRDLPGLLEPQ